MAKPKKSKEEKDKEVQFENELIKLVEPNPDIYDKASAKHKDQRHINFLWQTISASLTAATDIPCTEWECMNLWSKIRNRYSKERSTTRNVSSGSEGTASISKWIHFNSLAWLEPFIQKRRHSSETQSSFSNVTQNYDEDDEIFTFLDSETGMMMESQEVTLLKNSNTGSPPNKRIKKSNDTDLTKVLTSASNALDKLLEAENDNLRVFCDYIYTELKDINCAEKIKDCKKSIIDTIFAYKSDM